MKADITINKVDITHDDLVTLFSDALYGDYTFDVYVDEKNKPLKEGEGDCYEDKLANVLQNGGYICVAVNEEADNSKDRVDNVSDVLQIAEFTEETRRLYPGHPVETIYTPVYHIDMARVEQAFKEILSKKTTGKYSDGLYQNYEATFVDEDGDFFDAWNIFQYIVFGDVIYG